MFAATAVSRVKERRSKQRYAIVTPLEYTVQLKPRLLVSGQGETINVSSNGLLFLANRQLPVGRPITLSVRWPVSLEGKIGLKLVVKGRTVWTQDNQVAVHFRNSEFRTAKAKASFSGADRPSLNCSQIVA